MNPTRELESLQAGTGFMLTLTDALKYLQHKGYVENLVPRFDHFECQSGKYKMYPHEIRVDKIIRFENTSDPDDQAILYAISYESENLKGVYVDSFGFYHDELSNGMIERLKDHPH